MRQHVIADLSVYHVEGHVLDAGHTVQRLSHDYGYDLMLTTYDEDGYVEPGAVYLRLKAAEALTRSGPNFAFDLDVRDYNLWMTEKSPVLLVLFDASKRKAYWLFVKQYFKDDESRRPRRGAKTVRVCVPRRQVVTRKGVGLWRD